MYLAYLYTVIHTGYRADVGQPENVAKQSKQAKIYLQRISLATANKF